MAGNNGLAELDQRRAKHAWETVQAVKKLKSREIEDYVGEAHKLPMRIISSGLGQALAFLNAKAKEKKQSLKNLLEDLTDWNLRERKLPGSKPDSLLGSVIYGNSDFLRLATQEVLAYMQWLNRFAEAELKSKSSEEN